MVPIQVKKQLKRQKEEKSETQQISKNGEAF